MKDRGEGKKRVRRATLVTTSTNTAPIKSCLVINFVRTGAGVWILAGDLDWLHKPSSDSSADREMDVSQGNTLNGAKIYHQSVEYGGR